MDNVVTFNPKANRQEKNKAALLDVIEYLKKEIEEGRIQEFVGATMDENGQAQIHVFAFDTPGAVGLFEIGKHILMSQHE